MRCPECGKKLESKVRLCPNCRKPTVSSKPRTSVDSQYADVLKPRSTIRVKGVGSKMTGSASVPSVRHKITTSDKTGFSVKLRCSHCGTENSKNDLVCRKCGTRIPS